MPLRHVTFRPVSTFPVVSFSVTPSWVHTSTSTLTGFGAIVTDATGAGVTVTATPAWHPGHRRFERESEAVGFLLSGSRRVYFAEAEGYVDCPVYDRYRLFGGARIDGPAVVEERESTLVVGPGGRFEVLESGNIIVSIG